MNSEGSESGSNTNSGWSSKARRYISDVCPRWSGPSTRLKRFLLPGVSWLTDSSGAERSGELRISCATAAAPEELHLAAGVFSPSRVARIINLCITFPADRRHRARVHRVTEIDLGSGGMGEEGSLAAWQTAPYLSIFTFCSVHQVQREPHFLDWLGNEAGRRTE